MHVYIKNPPEDLLNVIKMVGYTVNLLNKLDLEISNHTNDEYKKAVISRDLDRILNEMIEIERALNSDLMSYEMIDYLEKNNKKLLEIAKLSYSIIRNSRLILSRYITAMRSLNDETTNSYSIVVDNINRLKSISR